MDALELLHQHIDMEVLLNHYDFDNVRSHGTLVRSCCKLHGGNNPSAFVVNTDNKLWYCHTGGCGGGDAYTLVQRLEDCDFHTAVRKVASLFGVDIQNLQIAERKASHVKEMKVWLDVMRRKTKKVETHEYVIREEVKEVAKYRSFQPDTLSHFGLGYVQSVALTSKDGRPYTLHNRLVIPIRENGIQIGASFRRVKNTDIPKWSHQPVSLETRNLLYNYDACKSNPVIVIVEGMLDVWAYYEIGVDAVATFGAHITDEQYRLLMKTGSDLVFSFDGDEAGKHATDKARNLFRYKANTYVVPFNEGEDPASITREQLKLNYEGRKRL